MKNQPNDSTGELPNSGDQANVELVPKTFVLAPDVKNSTQVINMARVRLFEGGGRIPDPMGSASSRHSINIEPDLNSSGGRSQASEYHIAFGSKVPGSSKGEPRKGSGREGNTSSRQYKSSHSRTKSDGGSSDGQGSGKGRRQPSKDRLTVESAKGQSQSQRERKNSDPGTNTEDPEITVDKESLRTSHTWTDGADNKEDIPFVKPHPPRQPSSASEKRRKPRVKSAGKERSAGRERTKHSNQKESGASPQSSQSSHNHSYQPDNYRSAPQMADDDEAEKFLREMQQGAKSEMYRSESESDFGSNNSSALSRDAEMSEVISTLNMKEDGPIEYAEEEEDKVSDNIYMYHSKPKTLTHKERRKNQRSKPVGRRRGADSRLEGDFVRSASTDEEDSQRFDRPLHVKTSPQQANPPALRNGGGFLNIPAVQQLASPQNSQSRVSVNKSSLREIPKEEIRKSGGAKPYEAQRYQMTDFSDSCEANMLRDLKKEAMEDGLESDENDDQQNRPKGLSRSRVNYGNDEGLSDSSDDTATSTLKGGQTDRNYNYHNEMGILSQEFLTQSNPRDWGNVFSPPIVLPSSIAEGNMSAQTSTDISSLSPGGPGKSHFEGKPPDEREEIQEDKLELLFDPVLNVYFDPKTKIYYELKP